jgi:transcription elongation factor Elf1
MVILYSCACGARNSVEVNERPPREERPFFYCHDCGKPSLNHCTRCGFNAPVGSNHTFCKGCGARTEESFQEGVETLDFVGEALKPYFVAPVLAFGAYFVLNTCFRDGMAVFERKTEPLSQMIRAASWYVHDAFLHVFAYAFVWLLGWVLVYALVQKVIGLFWGMRMGKTPMPLLWREVARRGPFPMDQDDLEAGIRQGRWLWLYLRRRITPTRRRRIRSACAKFAAWKAG